MRPCVNLGWSRDSRSYGPAILVAVVFFVCGIDRLPGSNSSGQAAGTKAVICQRSIPTDHPDAPAVTAQAPDPCTAAAELPGQMGIELADEGGLTGRRKCYRRHRQGHGRLRTG